MSGGESIIIKDADQKVQGFVIGDRIYDNNFRLQGMVGKEGVIKDTNFRIKGTIKPLGTIKLSGKGGKGK